MAIRTARPVRCASSRAALAWLLAAAIGSPRAVAAPTADELRVQVEAALEAADRAGQAGDHVLAAEKYAEAVALLPERREHQDGRALALLDSVRARRRAFAALGDPLQLCAARELIARYLAEAAQAYGIAAATMDGPTAAARERQDVDAALDAAHATCPQGQAQPPPREDPGPPVSPPPPAPGPRRPATMIAGGVTLGVGAGLLVMMAAGLGLGSSAEAAGRDLRRQEPTRDIDGLLDADFYRRGQAGNGMAIAGGVIGGVAVIVGASLLIVGARKRGPRAVARRLGAAGPALRFRF